MVRGQRGQLSQVTIYLLRRGTQGPDGAIEPVALGEVDRRDLRADAPLVGAVYLRPQQSNPPSWQTFVNDGLSPSDAIRLVNRHAAVVLVIRVARHWFAIPFGFGYHLIREEAIEPGFGLKVTLNSVDAGRLRSIDVRRIEEMTVQSRQNASQTTGLESFGFDIARDILGGVTGQPRDPQIAQTMTGRDMCVLHGPVRFDQLGEKCKMLLDAYDRETYKQGFAFIDLIRRVEQDDSLCASLDQRLVDALMRRDFSKLHFAAPEQLDWAMVAGFLYSGEPSGSVLHADLDPDDYLNVLAQRRGSPILDVARLHRDRAAAYGGPADTRLGAWSIYKCSVFQTETAGKVYVLSGGVWYEVEATFAADIARQVATIAEFDAATLGLPGATPGEHEDLYLQRAVPVMSQALGVPVALMDQRMVRAADAATPIEVCDIFTGAKQFIHVKRRTRSSTLSHLFAQGTASAQAFASDSAFREAARAQAAQTEAACGTGEFFPTEQPTARDFTIVFAVIARGADSIARALPFLSQVMLSHAARQIRGWGYEVAVTRIDQL